MIIDTLDNGTKYASLHPSFAKAFEYLQGLDYDTLEVGKYTVDGDNIRVIVSEKEGMSIAESIAKFECHDKHIDIQMVIKGNEQIGWKPRGACLAQKGEYNPEKDVLFFNDIPDTYFGLTDKQFVIFYPEDVHAPMISEGIDQGPIKKLVVKVKI